MGVLPLTEYRGIITALITPFDSKGDIDEQGLKQLVERQIEAGIAGVAVVAGSGEYVNLSAAERARVVEVAAEAAAGRIPVLAGVLEPNSRDAVSWAREAQRLGAGGLLVLTPFYNKPSPAGVMRHFRAVAEATELPVLLYNNPGRTGISLTLDDYVQLRDIPTIRGVKECNRDLNVFSQILAEMGSTWSILSGEDDLLFPSLMLGAPGGILTTSNVLPERWVAMYQACLEGDVERARGIHYEVLPFINTVYTLNHPALVKKALTLLGLPAGPAREPLAEPTEEQVQRLRSLLSL